MLLSVQRLSTEILWWMLFCFSDPRPSWTTLVQRCHTIPYGCDAPLCGYWQKVFVNNVSHPVRSGSWETQPPFEFSAGWFDQENEPQVLHVFVLQCFGTFNCVLSSQKIEFDCRGILQTRQRRRAAITQQYVMTIVIANCRLDPCRCALCSGQHQDAS